MSNRKLRCMSMILSAILAMCPVTETMSACAEDQTISGSAELTDFYSETRLADIPVIDDNGNDTGRTYLVSYRVSNDKAEIVGGSIADAGSYVRIPEEIDGYTVTSVTNFVKNKDTVETVVFPPTVERIVDSFTGCTNLNSVKFEGAIHNIESSFTDCPVLMEVVFDKTDNVYLAYSFKNCPSLNWMTLWYNTRIYINDSFSGTTVRNVNYYGTEAEATSREIQLKFPNAEIHYLMYSDDGMKWYMYNGKAYIDSFENREDSTYVVPAKISGYTVADIRKGAFPYNPLVLSRISRDVWQEFEVAGDFAETPENVKFGYRGKHLLGDYEAEIYDNNAILVNYTGTDTDVVIPSEIDGFKVTALKDTFRGNTEVESVTIPASVTEILTGNPFRKAVSLKKITVAEDNPVFASEDGVLYSKDKSKLIAYPAASSAGKGLVIDSTVREIGDYALSEADFDYVFFPSTIEKFGRAMFDFRRNPVFFEDEIETAKSKNYTPEGGATYCSEISGDFIYSCAKYYQKGDEFEYNGVKFIADSSTGPIKSDEYSVEKYIGAGGDVTIISELNGKPVTSVTAASLQHSDNIKSITLGKNIREIGDHAFNCCKSLTTVKAPVGLEKIGNNAFGGCDVLSTVELPEGLKSIGSNAFRYCSALTSIKIPEGVTALNEGLFESCGNLAEISLPSTLETIDNTAFKSCRKLDNITISENNANFSSEKNVIYNKDKSEAVLICGGVGKLTVIADGAKELCSGCFDNYFADKGGAVYLPSTVNADLKDIKADVFSERDGYRLSDNIVYSVYKDGAVIEYIADLPDAYTTPETVNGFPVVELGEKAFANNSHISDITLSEGIKDVYSYMERVGKVDMDDWEVGCYYSLNSKSSDGAVRETALMTATEANEYIEAHPELQFTGKSLYRYSSTFKDLNNIEKLSLPKTFKSIDARVIPKYQSINLTINADDVYIEEGALNCRIYGNTGSESEKYAIEHGLSFTPLDKADAPSVYTGSFSYQDIGSGIKITGYESDTDEYEDVVIPAEIDGKKVIAVGEYTFDRCNNVRSVTVSEGITRIERAAFAQNFMDDGIKISEIHLPASLMSVEGSINTTGLKVITVDENSKYFKAIDNVLYNANLTTIITYPAMKTDKEYIMPETVTGVYGNFWNDYIEKLTVSRDMPAPCPLGDLPSLSEITVQEGNTELYSENGVLFEQADAHNMKDSDYVLTHVKNYELSLYPPMKKGDTYSIPEGTVTVAFGAFDDNPYLKKVILPSTLEMFITEFADSKIEEFEVSEDSGTYSADNGVLFLKDGSKLVKYPPNAQKESYTVPKYVKTIGANSFSNTKVSEVILPEGLFSIDDKAFRNSAVTKINIPSTVKSVESSAFDIKNFSSGSDTVVIDGWLLGLSKDDETGAIVVPEGVKNIASNALLNYSESKLYLPSTLEYIGQNALRLNDELRDIYFNGIESDWKKVKIETQKNTSRPNETDPLTVAVMHYESRSPVTTQLVTTTKANTTTTKTAVTTTKTPTTTKAP
ncbi:MAG TPA: leucine-rich repeat protein, partial [Ruminococcus sp.]|nr:leucine-rich repeat protein [Ruminococcus sp.]